MIDEKKLIDRFKQLKGCDSLANMFISDVINEIKQQPKIDKWIPCSEQLPEEPEDGLVDLEECEEYIVTIKEAEVSTTLIYAGNGEWYLDGKFYNVVAWQPLPDSYKETI